MTKRLTRILCLIFVSAILISTISASDIITGTTAINPPDEPNAPNRCYVEVIKSGVYVEHWDSGVMYDISFRPGSISNVYYNGHNHSGSLTTWQLWDNGSSQGYYTVPTGQFSYDLEYRHATAKFYGYMTCSS